MSDFQQALRERLAARAAQDKLRGAPDTFLAPTFSAYRCPDSAALALTQTSRELPANADADTPGDDAFVMLLNTEAAIAWGRQINLFAVWRESS